MVRGKFLQKNYRGSPYLSLCLWLLPDLFAGIDVEMEML